MSPAFDDPLHPVCMIDIVNASSTKNSGFDKRRRESNGRIRNPAIAINWEDRPQSSRPRFVFAELDCWVAMLSVTAVGVGVRVKVAGVNVQLALVGRLAQLIETVPEKLPVALMFKAKVAGCPDGTVALVDAGGAMTKSGVTAVPDSVTVCEPALLEIWIKACF